MPDIRDGQSADEIDDFNTEMANWVPAREVAAEVEHSSRIANPDWVIALCSECASEVNESRAERNPFVQAGQSMPCPFCGAPCIITFGELREEVIQRITAKRGAF